MSNTSIDNANKMLVAANAAQREPESPQPNRHLTRKLKCRVQARVHQHCLVIAFSRPVSLLPAFVLPKRRQSGSLRPTASLALVAHAVLVPTQRSGHSTGSNTCPIAGSGAVRRVSTFGAVGHILEETTRVLSSSPARVPSSASPSPLRRGVSVAPRKIPEQRMNALQESIVSQLGKRPRYRSQPQSREGEREVGRRSVASGGRGGGCERTRWEGRAGDSQAGVSDVPIPAMGSPGKRRH
ncbi:hypothetical protein B0H11DRAFT_1941987 [Mycena galericulata]|nr:hypothetical protein B0H11DRAFT_1941987 [Mycena galericulata]